MWYLPWSENIKKRACRYLLQRYLGNFLEEKLTLDQLSVDLYNGTGTVCNVSLDCEALNELGDSQNWPLEIVDGQMKEITVTIPWSTLLKDDSTVEVDGLLLTVQPKERSEPASSMLESMWSSMSSSMQLAADCLREEESPQQSQPVEGIEMFAHAIDSILSRVKVRFINSIIRIEHVPKNCDKGIALEIHIESIDYFDEAGTEPIPEITDPDKPKTYIVSTFTNKKIIFAGVTFYTDEFPSKLRTMARSLIMEKSGSSQLETSDINYQSTSDIFYETRSVISTIDSDIKDILTDNSRLTSRDVTPEEKASQPDPILFAKLTGQQELSLKLKHSQEVEGPKVEVKMLLGAFIVFISPRQLHTLIELINALNQPHLEDRSNIPMRSNATTQCKPMGHADFQVIEAQLLSNFDRDRTKRTEMPGWSGPSFDDSDDESEKFFPMTSSNNQMTESFSSSVSSMSSSMTSNIIYPTTQSRVKRNKKVPQVDGDPTAEISHISVRITSLSCVLIHKDILVPQFGMDKISIDTINKMQEVSNEFFVHLEPFSISNGDQRELNIAMEALDRAAGRNHLRILTSDLTLDGSEKVTSHGAQTMCEASIKRLLVQESLQNGHQKPDCFDLVRFDSNDKDASNVGSRPNIKINFKLTSKFIRIAGEKKAVNPTVDVVVKCVPLNVEVDLTVVDRMAATLLGGTQSNTSPLSTDTQQFNFTLHCSHLHTILRFPIADLRLNVNREIRHIRPDFMVLKFQNLTLSTQRLPSMRPLPLTVNIKATTVDLYYHENDNLPGTHIASSSIYDFAGNVMRSNNPAIVPTISITFQPQKASKGFFDNLIEEPHFEAPTNPMTTSMYVMKNLQSADPSPFSGKKVAHQSIIKHEGSPHAQDDELIVPGSEEEMAEFINNSIENSSVHLDLSLPFLSLQLESKQLYEIIYNRIVSDLLLWTPNVVNHYDLCQQMYGDIYPAFGMCKGTDYESDSGSNSSEDENLYYSTHESKLRKDIGSSKLLSEKKDTHNFCLTLKVNKGVLTIYAPVRDSNKRVVPCQMGELVLEAQKLALCHVSGLNGLPKTAQLSLRSEKITLHHEAILTIPSEKPSLRIYGTVLPQYLKQTIFPSSKGVTIKENIKSKDMFTLALKVEPDLETPGLKHICIALGLEQATLRHRGEKGVAWLTQFMDVIDVLDFPVPGYTPSTVLSEIHVHLWDCAIYYRPLYLPVRSVVTIGSFSLSSNVIPETNTSCLRFLLQECTLFLSQVMNTKHNIEIPQDDDKIPNVHKDYVCVVDLGVFELSLRMEDKKKVRSDQLQVDLSASNNMVTLYTCWDSASALCRLLTYLASDGDLTPPIEPPSRHTSICSDQPLEPLVGLDDHSEEEIRELSPSEIQQVNDLMAEAMKESPDVTLEDNDAINSSTEKEGVEIFFFPDESNTKQKPDSSEDAVSTQMDIKDLEEYRHDHFRSESLEDLQDYKPTNLQVAKELGDPTVTSAVLPNKSRRTSDGNSTDEEYCILDPESYCEDDDLAEPIVIWLNGDGPPPMIENHFFKPAARADVLEAPKSFPPPILRYTLCEMSVMWNMFGGSDFQTSTDTATVKKTVKIEGDKKLTSSPTLNRSNKEYEPYETSRATAAAYKQSGVSWSAGSERVRSAAPPRLAPRQLRTRGGAHRDHDTCVKLALSKVKFRREVYPTGGKEASFQTLAVSRIEILDRLICSDINKLLSLYRLKDEPERKHAQMLQIKAAFLRPDPTLSAQECCLKVSLLPLRFNLDQDTVNFLIDYFSKLGSDEAGSEDESKKLVNLSNETSGSRQTTPTHRPPVMSIGHHLKDPPPTPTSLGDVDALSLNENVTVNHEDEPLMETYEAERLVSENLIQLEEDFNRLSVSQEKPVAKTSMDPERSGDSPIYFRRVVFSPEVPIRLDYVGKRVDLSAGPVAGLLMGLGHLNCSELTLKQLDYKLGILGLEKLVHYAIHEWLSDIKRHQLPGLLSGIGPMHSLLQLITGIRDLLWLPVEQWRRDGRLVHGLRRGAASFTARSAVAALDITTRLLQLIQATAETAFDMLTPGPTLQLQDTYNRRQRRRRRRTDPSRHPTDIREGVASAYQTVRDGFADTAETMAVAARSESGVGVLRHLPGAAVTPLALAAAGAADVLGGLRAALAPAAARDSADKWRRLHAHTDPSMEHSDQNPPLP